MDTELRKLQRSTCPLDRQRLARLGARLGLTFDETFGRKPVACTPIETIDGPRIVIDGERFHVSIFREIGWNLWEIETFEGEEFILAESSEVAGKAARDRWREMATEDPDEFAHIVGVETLVSWGLGQLAGPGTAKVPNLDAWLDTVAEHPDEEWAQYDGLERTVERVGKLAQELGFIPKVAYRSN